MPSMNQHMSMGMMPKQTLSPVLNQEQRQSLLMLQMNSFELDQFIEQNLEINPFLERVGGRETALSEMPERPDADRIELDEQVEHDYEQEVLGRSESDASQEVFSDGWDPTERYREGGNFTRNSDLDDVWRYYQDSITQGESLSAHLLDQMRITATTPRE